MKISGEKSLYVTESSTGVVFFDARATSGRDWKPDGAALIPGSWNILVFGAEGMVLPLGRGFEVGTGGLLGLAGATNGGTPLVSFLMKNRKMQSLVPVDNSLRQI